MDDKQSLNPNQLNVCLNYKNSNFHNVNIEQLME